MVKSFALAMAALLPLAAGTSPHDVTGDAITVALCNGGEITIDLGLPDKTPERDCETMACHAGTCREKHKGKLHRPT